MRLAPFSIEKVSRRASKERRDVLSCFCAAAVPLLPLYLMALTVFSTDLGLHSNSSSGMALMGAAAGMALALFAALLPWREAIEAPYVALLTTGVDGMLALPRVGVESGVADWYETRAKGLRACAYPSTRIRSSAPPLLVVVVAVV